MEIANRYPGAVADNESKAAIDKELCKSIPRNYIVYWLKRNGFVELANSLPVLHYTGNHVHEVIQEIADTLLEERELQFQEMLATLNLTADNIEQTYDSIMYEMFKDKVNWGKIITFVGFTAHFCVHCARSNSLRQKVPNVLDWADGVMNDQLQSWIEAQGGVQAFVEHYDTENWRVDLSTGVMFAGLALTAVTAGFMALKKFIMY